MQEPQLLRQPPVFILKKRAVDLFSAIYLNVKKYADSNQVRQRKESTNAYRDSDDERDDSPFFLRAIIIVLCAKRFLKAHAEKQEGESFLQTEQTHWLGGVLALKRQQSKPPAKPEA